MYSSGELIFGNHNQLHVSFQILFSGRAYQVREYGAVNIGGLLYVFVLFFVYEYFTWTYICALTVCLMPTEVKRWYQIPWNWRCRSLWGTMWVLGTSAWFSKRTTSEPNHVGHLSSPRNSFQKENNNINHLSYKTREKSPYRKSEVISLAISHPEYHSTGAEV